MTVDVTIRFPQIDAAGIMFYPRCFELLARHFQGSPLDTTPISVRTTFAHPLRLGDRITLRLDEQGDYWSYSASLDGLECFRVESLEEFPELESSGGFVTQMGGVGNWACGPAGRMALSRSFEYVNVAVEEFFEHVLESAFADLHVGRRIGIPTVEFLTRVHELPRPGDAVSMATDAVAIGTKSLTLTHALRRGTDCLVENRQVLVFVEMQRDGFRSVRIPDDVRDALEEKRNVAA